MSLQFEKEMKLNTARLQLRTIQETDGPFLFEQIFHDEAVLRYFLASYQEIYDAAYFQKLVNYYHQNQWLALTVSLKESGEIIGFVLQQQPVAQGSIELGYAYGSRYWNQGYGSEALQAVIDDLFKRGAKQVTAGFLEGNDASRRVMEKCGMHYQGTEPDLCHWHEKDYRVILYAIEREKRK